MEARRLLLESKWLMYRYHYGRRGIRLPFGGFSFIYLFFFSEVV